LRHPGLPSLLHQQLTLGPAGTTYFGAGTLTRLPASVGLVGKRRAFVVTERGVAASGVAGAVMGMLAAAGVETGVFDKVRTNPTVDDVEAGSHVLRKFGDAAVVAVGGGSALDAAKGISLAATNQLPVTELDYRNEPQHPGFPLVAVPTTAGTGAETNGFGVIGDPAARRKFYVGHESVAPRAAVLDPELTLGLPSGPTAATGMDALIHALESMSSRRANPYARGLGLEVVRMVTRWLPTAVADGLDLEARAQMLLAAHLAGLAFSTTGLGLCHAIGHALSARLGTPHGVALTVVLPHVLEFNAAVTSETQSDIAAAMGGDRLAVAVRRLSTQLGMPETLRALDCTEEVVPIIVSDALADPVIVNTPRMPTQDQLTDLLSGAMGDRPAVA